MRWFAEENNLIVIHNAKNEGDFNYDRNPKNDFKEEEKVYQMEEMITYHEHKRENSWFASLSDFENL